MRGFCSIVLTRRGPATDDNFASIVTAVEEGRAIFASIQKFLCYLLSSNLGEVLTMLFGVLLAKRIGLRAEEGVVALPLLATRLVWTDLVTDGAPALALGIGDWSRRAAVASSALWLRELAKAPGSPGAPQFPPIESVVSG